MKTMILSLLVVLLCITSFSHLFRPIAANANTNTVVTADMLISLDEKRASAAPSSYNQETKPVWKKIFPKLKPYTKPGNPKINETHSKILYYNKKRTPLKIKSIKDCTEQISIKLKHGDKVFKYADEKLTPSNHLVALDFHNKKINGTYTEKKQLMNQCLTSGSTYKYAVLFSMPLLENIVNSLVCTVFSDAKDSKIIFNPNQENMFDITKEKPGYKVNEEALYKDIYFSLLASPNVEINIKTIALSPNITAKDNAKLINLTAKHSTNFSNSSENRAHNIKLALKKINGTRLEAGEEFSFNQVVGKRTKDRGFKEGNIIVSGKYEKGIGGGVCQVSTTLYNAALLGGMDITLVKNHSLECGYELPSFDAMVSSAQDLKFKNNGKTPVFIKAFSENGRAVVEFYGEKMPHILSRKYEIVHRKEAPPINKIVDTGYKYHNEDAISGEQKVVYYPRGELKTIGYLVYSNLDGSFIKQRKIRQDVYKASEGLLAIAP